MKLHRIVQLVLLTLAGIYVVVMQNANPAAINLPGLLPLPLWLLLFVVSAFTYLAGWLPGSISAWRGGRERARLERRIQELEAHLPNYDAYRGVVIPDRPPRRDPSTTSRRDARTEGPDAS